MTENIEALFAQLDTALAALQAGLRDEPGHHCACLVASAREDLARAQRYVRHAIECDAEHREEVRNDERNE